MWSYTAVQADALQVSYSFYWRDIRYREIKYYVYVVYFNLHHVTKFSLYMAFNVDYIHKKVSLDFRHYFVSLTPPLDGINGLSI